MYLLAILCPPLAVLLCGKPFQAVLNLLLTLMLMWIGGILHAILVVSSHRADQRNAALVKAIKAGEAAPAKTK